MGIPKKMKTLTARTANKVLHDTSMTWHGHSSCCSYLQIVSHCQLASEWATAPPTFLTLHFIMAISTRSRNNNILQSHFCAKKDYYVTWFFLKVRIEKNWNSFIIQTQSCWNLCHWKWTADAKLCVDRVPSQWSVIFTSLMIKEGREVGKLPSLTGFRPQDDDDASFSIYYSTPPVYCYCPLFSIVSNVRYRV